MNVATNDPAGHGSGRARACLYVLAMVFALSISYDLLRMPFQPHDSLEELLAAQRSPSIAASFVGSTKTVAYLRPARVAQIKGLFDLAQGRYFRTYRGFQAILIVVAFLLFTSALRVQSWRDVVAGAFALTVFMGLHTFFKLVVETYPVNHFLEMVVFCLLVLNLAQSRGGWWVDAGAAVTFAVASLTLESGVLVWVTAAAAWMVGLRGISGRGIVAMTLLFAGYGYLRFGYLHVGVPTMLERSSGFLLERLDPQELQRRFAQHPGLLYAYNVLCALLSVLFSEPQDGTFSTVRAWLDSRAVPWMYLALGTSVPTTGLIAWAAVNRWRRRARGGLEQGEQLFLIVAAVLVSNACLSFAYVKDDIVSVAGVFYALAAFAAMRDTLEALSRAGRRPMAIAVAVLVFAVSSGWAIRSFGVQYRLRAHDFRQRNEWAATPEQWKRDGLWPDNTAGQALIQQLRREAMELRVVNPQFFARWGEGVFGE